METTTREPDERWYQLPPTENGLAHRDAHDAWVHPSGAQLVLLWEPVNGEAGVGCWTWQLDMEHEVRHRCYPMDRVPEPPFDWVRGMMDEHERDRVRT